MDENSGRRSVNKLLWVKFAWSDWYQGGQVKGNFEYLNSDSMKANREGHEAYNFKPFPDGRYGIYIPPQSGGYWPQSDDPSGWTVICLSKHPRRTGIHIVGWLENATLLGPPISRPEYDRGGSLRKTREGDHFTYSIVSHSVFFVPPEKRERPFSHKSIKQGKYSILRPVSKPNERKEELARLLLSKLDELESVSISNPPFPMKGSPLFENVDPFFEFGTADHRARVEQAAVQRVCSALVSEGFSVRSREAENIGYDLDALRGEQKLAVEVKGTSLQEPAFFLSANEEKWAKENPENWRLAIVIQALSDNSQIHWLTRKEFEDVVEMRPLSWRCTVREGR